MFKNPWQKAQKPSEKEIKEFVTLLAEKTAQFWIDTIIKYIEYYVPNYAAAVSELKSENFVPFSIQEHLINSRIERLQDTFANGQISLDKIISYKENLKNLIIVSLEKKLLIGIKIDHLMLCTDNVPMDELDEARTLAKLPSEFNFLFPVKASLRYWGNKDEEPFVYEQRGLSLGIKFKL